MIKELFALVFDQSLNPQVLDIPAVSQSFATRSKAFTDSPEVLIGLCVIFFLLGLVMFLLYTRRKNIKYIPHGWVTDAKIIRSVLDLAIDQRSTFEMRFLEGHNRNRPLLRCAGIELKGNDLVLEANGVVNVAAEWVGNKVEAFFKVTVEHKFIYYAVSARIKDTQPYGSERVHIRLDSFEKLENRQKRSFLRISPPSELIMGGGFWYRTLPEEDVRNDASLWPRPDLVILPERLEQFSVQDISAGGTRVKIPSKAMQGWERKFAVGEHIFLLLSLLEPDDTKRLSFWLQCRVQNITVEYVTQDVTVGLQFLAWATVREGTGTTLEWLKLTSNFEVGQIANWVIKRHLEIFRERPEMLDI